MSVQHDPERYVDFDSQEAASNTPSHVHQVIKIALAIIFSSTWLPNTNGPPPFSALIKHLISLYGNPGISALNVTPTQGPAPTLPPASQLVV